MNIVSKIAILSAVGFTLSACSAYVESDSATSEDIEGLEQSIVDGQDVQPGHVYAKSTVSVPGCTGTIIGPRHVLTAAHCLAVRVGSIVRFYDGASPSGVTAKVTRVYVPDGVSSSDTEDDEGDFADYMVLFLDRAIPATSTPAKLASRWPGNGVTMAQVGSGQHDTYDNPLLTLRYRSTRSYSAAINNGSVLVESTTNNGDSGGPIYTAVANGRLTVHGTNWGDVVEWAMRGKYTSTSFHLLDIARAVGIMPRANWDFVGSDIRSIDNVLYQECLSECLVNNNCRAYTFVMNPLQPAYGRCFLKSGTGTGGRAASAMISGTRAATGACRADGAVCRL